VPLGHPKVHAEASEGRFGRSQEARLETKQ